MTKLSLWKLTPAPTHSSSSSELLEPVNLPASASTLNRASHLLPGGVYTTFRTYEGLKTLSLDHHYRRLEESAALLDSPVTLDRPHLRLALRRALRHFSNGEARVRLTLDLEQQPGEIYLALEPLESPTQQDYQHGVSVVTCRSQRRNPSAKYTAFIAQADAIRQGLPAGAHECLMVGENGLLLEGLSSNFFAIIDGVAWTARESVLSGITRSLVIQAAQRIGVELNLQAVAYNRIPELQEAFLTSATRAVLPVRQIDATLVGSGVPGPLTRQLGEAYQQEIDRWLEEV
jgi:branched-chain amino acid aminotransferase